MAGAVLLAFLVGVGVGFYLGRRGTSAAPSTPAPAAPEPSTTTPVLTKRGRKAGLTPEAFQPADDILERLRKVEAGELDPTELHVPPTGPEPEQPVAPGVDPVLAERERRILERLQREGQEGGEVGESDVSKQRDSDEER